MRFVDARLRGLTGVALLATAVVTCGCASVGEPLKAMQQSLSSTVSNATAAVTAPAKEAPVAPATQRAFDDAARALRAGRVDEAERGFKAIAQANPELGGPHANLGMIYRQAGKLPEAAAEFEQAAKLNPRQALYFNQLGVSYRQQGRFDKAREAYERAIALDDKYAAPVLNLGILNDLYLGDAPKALDLYARYLALSPEGDAVVSKWVVELKNRKPVTAANSKKEKA
jgi:tetratricopeptide (TPR) repeat protein